MHPSDLHVVSVISNPVRYKSRVRLFHEFLARIDATGVTHWVVEAAFGERPFEIVDPTNPRHFGLRSAHELWNKEALINRAVVHFPPDWKYCAWIDGDVSFVREDWASEILHALQHYSVVQPFSHAIDLGPQYETMQVHTGFAFQHLGGKRIGRAYGGYFHPGYAWAWRRSAWDDVGGMIDFAIGGSADHHMACALVGEGHRSLPKGIHGNYARKVKEWQGRADRHIRGNIGCVPGTILHYFHGAKVHRRYQDRWSILVNNNYDPEVDIIRDGQGLPQLTRRKPRLRDDLRRYFRERQEDLLVT